MQNNSQDFINNSSFSSHASCQRTNAPSQYNGLQNQYMSSRTALFVDQRASLSTDFVQAKVQGLKDCFWEYTTVNVRLSNVSEKLKVSGKSNDDIKEMLVADGSITYIPIGAKVIAMGSTWIVTNTANISSVVGKAVIERCNASYNSYDEYGNVVTEPLIVDQKRMLGNANGSYENIVLMDGNFDIRCQLNETTSKLGINKRIILGTKPYYLTGFTDFLQEFTGDRNSVHLLSFSARIDEPTELDDLENNYIADGNAYSFSAALYSQRNVVRAGGTESLTAVFLVNDEPIFSGEQKLSWWWQSTNTSVATVSNGTVSALSPGETVITAILAQNPSIQASITINVSGGVTEPYVTFDGTVPDSIQQYDSYLFSALYYENGEETSAEISWEFSGADESCYYTDISDDGAYCNVQCLRPSNVPLAVTASVGDVSATASVVLEGY